MERKCRLKMCGCNSHNGFLTAKGLEKAAQRDVCIDGVDGMDMFGYLDSRVSVSAVGRDETMLIFDDEVIENQYRRFLEAGVLG